MYENTGTTRTGPDLQVGLDLHILSAHTIFMTTLSHHRAELPHSASTVYALWADPRAWPKWDPDVTAVEFDGGIRMGAQGRMRPASGPSTTFTITRLEADRRVTTTSRLPGATLTFDHLVEPGTAGSDVEVRISVDGALAPLWRRLLGRTFALAATRNISGLSQHLVSR